MSKHRKNGPIIVKDTTVCPYCETQGTTDIREITKNPDLIEFYELEDNVAILCKHCKAAGTSYDGGENVLWKPNHFWQAPIWVRQE